MEKKLPDQSVLNSPWVGLGAGLAVGAGAMIVFLAKWGSKIFGTPVAAEKVDDCPYAKDHPALQKFMGESTRDRSDMRDFLEDINGKVERAGLTISKIEGKLDLLLQGARVRWNGDMPKR